MKNLITINEAAKILGKSRRCIYYWIEKGIAPKFERFGDRYYFYAAAVEKKAKQGK